jgi:hypothetical protein
MAEAECELEREWWLSGSTEPFLLWLAQGIRELRAEIDALLAAGDGEGITRRQ